MIKIDSIVSHSVKIVVLALVSMTVPAWAEPQARTKRAKKRMHKEVVIRYTEEKIDGRVFTHRVDIANGDRKERWSIDGDAVSQEEYEEAILEAERAERKRERQRLEDVKKQEEIELAQQQEFAQRSKILIERKRLQLLLDQVETELAKLHSPKLAPYYVFNEGTFDSVESFNHLCDALVPQAHELCESDIAKFDEVQKLATTLENQPSRLKALFRETVQHAISKCDDTRFLKELLEAV